MATVALRLEGVASARRYALVSLGLGLLGLALGWSGSAWDVAWHRAIGRDTFWSPPHTLMYIGTTLTGVAALVATLSAMGGRSPAARELSVGPFHVERGLAVMGVGALVIISAAPVDDLWHRTFGRDVDIWSPPHLVAIVGAVLAYAGLAAGVSVGFAGLRGRARAALVAALVGGVIGTMVFGMNFFYIFSWSRDAVLYPVVVSATVPFALALAATLIRGPFAATAAAAAFTVFGLLGYAALAGLGWPPPAFVPLVLASALCVDLARSRTRSAPFVAFAFVAAFVLVESARMLATDPLPSPAVLADRTVGHLATQYWTMARTRPWESGWPLVGLAVGVPLAALAWRAGVAGARWLAAPLRGD